MADEIVSRQIQEQRRPEYIERLEKALLGGIFGDEDSEGVLQDGLLQDPNLFRVAPYKMAGQTGRAQPIRFEDIVDDAGEVVGQRPIYAEGVQPGDITGFGLETFAAQALSQDLNNDGVPDFMGRYTPYFETAGGAATGGIEALSRGLGTVGEAKTFFGPAAQYVSGGRGMYDPSQYVSSYMSPYTSEVIDEVEKILSVKVMWRVRGHQQRL